MLVLPQTGLTAKTGCKRALPQICLEAVFPRLFCQAAAERQEGAGYAVLAKRQMQAALQHASARHVAHGNSAPALRMF
jgi:hypothetical protein